MRVRHAVLLTPSISLPLNQALSCTQIMRETPQIPFYVFNSLRTLSFSVYNIFPFKRFAFNPFRTLCEKHGGVYQLFPHWNSKSSAHYPTLHPPSSNPFRFKLLRTLLHLSKTQLFSFQAIPQIGRA